MNFPHYIGSRKYVADLVETLWVEGMRTTVVDLFTLNWEGLQETLASFDQKDLTNITVLHPSIRNKADGNSYLEWVEQILGRISIKANRIVMGGLPRDWIPFYEKAARFGYFLIQKPTKYYSITAEAYLKSELIDIEKALTPHRGLERDIRTYLKSSKLKSLVPSKFTFSEMERVKYVGALSNFADSETVERFSYYQAASLGNGPQVSDMRSCMDEAALFWENEMNQLLEKRDW